MQYTENYSMNKPQFGENALVTKLNENADTLDTLIYNTRQMQADTYDSTQTYNTGDLVSYNSALYICLADNVTGAWDSTKWSATTLAEQVELAKQSGGESALADLEDVNITNPSEGQILTYDDANDEWVNTDMPDTAVTKEASGNPIEISDGASAPMVRCVTQITGSQDLHGYDKPWVGGAGKNKLTLSVDEIKALNTIGTWTGNVYAVANTTFTIETDNGDNVTSIVVNGTTDNNYQQLDIPINNSLMGTEIILSKGNDNNYIITGVLQNGSTKIVCITTEVTGTIPDSGTISSYVRLTANRTVNNVRVYPMIRLSTVTDSTFAPYSNICPITAYTEGEIEVRGKNLFDKSATDTSNGYVANYNLRYDGREVLDTDLDISEYIKITPDTKYILEGVSGSTSALCFYDESKTYISGIAYGITWGTAGNVAFTSPSNAVYIRFSIPKFSIDAVQLEKGESPSTYEPYVSTTHTTTYPSAIYRGSEDVVNGEVSADWLYEKGFTRGSIDSSGKLYNIGNLTGAEFTQSGVVATMLSSHLPVLSLEQARAANYPSISRYGITAYVGGYVGDEATLDALLPNLEIAYKLATPTTSSVTPTNLPVKSLSGYNHIESSTGDMEVEYITEEYQPLVDLIQSSNGHTYSTQEQVVGKWIDGKDLYEKTLKFTGTFYGSVTLGNIGVSNVDYLIVADLSGHTLDDTWRSLSFAHSDAQNNAGIFISSTGDVCMRAGSSVTAQYAYDIVTMTIRYTKTTTTRSLNAPVTSQKAQIEPLSEKEEEVPTEEEKAVNEEENNDETR